MVKRMIGAHKTQVTWDVSVDQGREELPYLVSAVTPRHWLVVLVIITTYVVLHTVRTLLVPMRPTISVSKVAVSLKPTEQTQQTQPTQVTDES